MLKGTLIDETTLGGVMASLIAAAIVGLAIFVFRNTLAKWVRYWIPRIESKTPHINFQTDEARVEDHWDTTVQISNAGHEPAYNVYVFMAELSPVGGHFRIRSLGASGVRRPVLGISDSLTFRGVHMHFDGCNVTKEPQLWIEFENSAGVAFRTVSIPRTPRNDDERTLPPRAIRHRLEQSPDLDIEGDLQEWRQYQKGARTAYGHHGWRNWIQQRPAAFWRLLRPTYIPDPDEGRLRSWLADKLERTT